MTPEALPGGRGGDQDIQQNVVLVEQKYRSLDREGLMAIVGQQEDTIQDQRRFIGFLEGQIKNLETAQIKMGLMLDKIPVDELLDKVILIKKQTVSPGRIKDYRYSKWIFVEYCKSRGITFADEITRDHDYEFREYMANHKGIKGDGWGKARQIHMQKAIKCAFAIGEDNNHVIRNPFKNIVAPFNPCYDWWDDEYFYALIDAIRKYSSCPEMAHRNEMITRIIYTTGIRVGIFLDVEHQMVRVTADGRLYITLRMKVPKSSDVQEHTYEIVNKTARGMFLHYYEPNKKGRMFPGGAYETYRNNLAGKTNPANGNYLPGIAEKAGLTYKNPHKAKHGFITKMLIKGYSEIQIAKLTGNLDTTVIRKTYNHIHASDFADRVKMDIEDL